MTIMEQVIEIHKAIGVVMTTPMALLHTGSGNFL